MSRIIVCDRCGAHIEKSATATGFVSTNWRSVQSGDFVGGVSDFENWDFCDDCMKQIEDFVRMKPDTAKPRVNPELVAEFHERNDPILEQQKEEEEELSPEHEPTDKPKATIKKPAPARMSPEQIEQIRTLVMEGHSVSTIAELVGVSAPTVRKYKKELEDVGSEE